MAERANSAKLVPVLIAVGTLAFFALRETAREPTPDEPPAVEVPQRPTAQEAASRPSADFSSATAGRVVTASPGRIPDNLPDDLRRQLEAPPPPIPEDIQRQISSPPPPLPDDLRRQLESPPPPLPDDLKAQLEAPPPPLPPDMQRALQTPPRIVTEAEVNDPNYIPPPLLEEE